MIKYSDTGNAFPELLCNFTCHMLGTFNYSSRSLLIIFRMQNPILLESPGTDKQLFVLSMHVHRHFHPSVYLFI